MPTGCITKFLRDDDQEVDVNTQNEDDHPQEIQPPEGVPSSREEQPLEPEPTFVEGHSETSLPPPRLKRTWRFAAGFLGWFLVNGLLWFWLSQGDVSIWEGAAFFGIFVFPLNVIIMSVLLQYEKLRPIGQGILAAFGVNLIISLILGLGNNAVCLIPFFTE